MSTVTLTLPALHDLAKEILIAHNTAEGNAEQVAASLAAAEADGQGGHGASRIPSYAAQAKSGKVDGHAVPKLAKVAPAALRVDARGGFALPAINLGVEALIELTRETGVAAVSIANSHHSGVAAHHVEPVANAGLIGLSFGNGPQGIAPWGGSKGLFGTNPIAFAAPRRKQPALVIDMSLSKVARGKINVAAQKGEAIPEGWAADKDGRPTTDPEAALEGTMLPMGDAKGAQLVLMVEILAAALSASHFGYEASSFFTGEGEPPLVGQFLIAIDPEPLSRNRFQERLEDLLAAIREQPGTRLPGERRIALRADAAKNGVALPLGLYEQLKTLRG
jgi:(2R)-3-sulfolactate dehydrogenase (NADP+)